MYIFKYPPWMARSTLIDLNPDENNQGLLYCSFMVNLCRCNGSCYTLDDPSSRYVSHAK